MKEFKTRGMQIGAISNYYGGLHVHTEAGKYYWTIESCDGCNWYEIPEILYRALVDYENARSTVESCPERPQKVMPVVAASTEKEYPMGNTIEWGTLTITDPSEARSVQKNQP